LKLIANFLLMLCLFGCVEQQNKIKRASDWIDEQDMFSLPSEIVFTGATHVSNITDTQATIHWQHKPGIESYSIISMDPINYTQNILKIAMAPANQVVIDNLNIASQYMIFVFADGLVPVNNTQFPVSFTTLSDPLPPSELIKIFPTEEHGQYDSVTIRVGKTKAGDVVQIFSDNTCTNLVGQGNAPPTGNYTDIQSNQLAVGAYNFHAKIINSLNNSSDCSEIGIDFSITECPYNYVKVEANPSLGINDPFCVAKYEMKCANDPTGQNCQGLPLSRAENLPWVNIKQAEAKSACESLGANFKLISNNEWMSIAREIEVNVKNWKNQSLGGNSQLNRGHSNHGPAFLIAASSEDNQGCYNLTQTCLDQWHINKRTFNLASDESIWDFAGNAWEWVDFELINDKPTPSNTWTDINQIVATASFTSTMYMSNDTNLSALINQTGAGIFGANGTKHVMKRGGNFNHGVGAGIYAFGLRDEDQHQDNSTGFRCTTNIINN